MQKTVILFLLVAFLKLTNLLSQNVSASHDGEEIQGPDKNNISSPLMMFRAGGEEKISPSDKQTAFDQTIEERQQTEKNSPTLEGSSDQAARGAQGGGRENKMQQVLRNDLRENLITAALIEATEETSRPAQQREREREENERNQKALDTVAALQQAVLNLEEESESLVQQARKASSAKNFYKISADALSSRWDQALDKAEETAATLSEILQKQSAATAPRHQASWNEALRGIEAHYSEWNDKITSWTEEKNIALRQHQHASFQHQQEQAQIIFNQSEQLLQEAEEKEAIANARWKQLEEGFAVPANHPIFHSPWEVALEAAKKTLSAFERTLTNYQRGQQEMGVIFPVQQHWEERIHYVGAKLLHWREKIIAAKIDPPYLSDPHLAELQQTISKKPWKEEGAAFEAFQKMTIARILSPKKEEHPFERAQLEQELAAWNANLAHQVENKKRWDAFRKFKQLSPQAVAAHTSLKQLKRKEARSVLPGDTASEVGDAVGNQKFYNTKSEASTATGSSLSTVSGLEAERLKRIIAEADKYEILWNILATQANTQRERYGGMPAPDYQACLNAWEKADSDVFDKEKKEAEQQETVARKARMEKDWEANKARWRLQQEIKQETVNLKDLENSVEQLMQGQRPSQKQEKEKLQQKIEIKKILLTDLKKTWREKAEQEPRFLALKGFVFFDPRDREMALNRALKRLEREDKKIVAEQFSSLEIEHENDPHAKAVENYSATLKTNKQQLLASYFQGINAERLNIQEWARTNKNAQQETARRYDLLIPQERAALARYQQITEEQATDAAFEEIPEALQAWSDRARESDAAAKRVESKRKHPSTRHYENSFEQSPQGLYMIAQADQAALEAFQREAQYLNDVKKTLEQERGLAQEHAFNKSATAAASHHAGEFMPWNMLPLEERRQHNELLGQQARNYLEAIEEHLENLLTNATKAIANIKEINEAVLTYYMTSSKQKAVDRAGDQEQELKRVIRLLSDPTYEATLQRALQERADMEEEQGLHLSLEKCAPNIITQIITQWKKERMNNTVSLHDLSVPLLQVIEAYEPLPIDEENHLLLKSHEELMRSLHFFQQEITRQIAIKNKSNIAPLEEEARQSETIVRATYDQSLKARDEVKYTLLDQAILEAEKTLLLWERALNAREEAFMGLRSSKREDVFYDLETAQDRQLFWAAEVANLQSTKLIFIFLDAREKAAGLEGDRALASWNKALELFKNIQQIEKKYVALCQKRVAITSSRFKAAAKRDLESALMAQADWSDLSSLKGQTASVMARGIWERLSFAFHEIPEASTELIACVREAAFAYEQATFFNKAQLSQSEERLKINWRRKLEQTERQKIFWDLRGVILEIPREKIQEKEAAWEALLQAAQNRVEAMESLLEEGLRKRNFYYTNDLEILQDYKTKADYNAAWCAALRRADAADVAWNSHLLGGPWNEVASALETTVAAWGEAVDVAKKLLAEAPEIPTDYKPSWRKNVREAKTQEALWEGKSLYWEAEKKEQEVTMAAEAASVSQNPTNWNEVFQSAQEVLTAWAEAFDLHWEKASHAPEHLKHLWLQNRDAIANKKQEWEQKLRLWKEGLALAAQQQK